MSQQLLDRPNVIARLEQVRRKRVAQRILTLLMNLLQPSFTTVTILFTANPQRSSVGSGAQ
ncbi:MAG TPA: hypothetical protein VI485_22665, partial [Vicinamibacterales bacterium]|nr:hypothetical protein [Vicinamibacterales bacterium]